MAKNSAFQLRIYPTPDEVVHHLADYFVQVANEAIAARGRFSVALSGGGSPKKLFELLASDAFRGRVEWQKADFFFGDERYVPHTSPDSNYRMAKLAMLDALRIEPNHIFPVDTSLPPAEAAQAYTQALQKYFGAEEMQLDLDLLGLGDNAHTASLFPHTPVLHATAAEVQAVYVEEVKAQRITLTAPLLNQARHTVFLVYGAGKATAVQQILTGPRDINQYPAQLIAPPAEAPLWFLDEAAAAALPADIRA